MQRRNREKDGIIEGLKEEMQTLSYRLEALLLENMQLLNFIKRCKESSGGGSESWYQEEDRLG